MFSLLYTLFYDTNLFLISRKGGGWFGDYRLGVGSGGFYTAFLDWIPRFLLYYGGIMDG